MRAHAVLGDRGDTASPKLFDDSGNNRTEECDRPGAVEPLLADVDYGRRSQALAGQPIREIDVQRDDDSRLRRGQVKKDVVGCRLEATLGNMLDVPTQGAEISRSTPCQSHIQQERDQAAGLSSGTKRSLRIVAANSRASRMSASSSSG